MHEVRNQRTDTREARDRELELVKRDRPQQCPDSFGPWPIRRRRVGVNAACPRDCCTSSCRRSPELFGKSRLSDTGLSANPDDARAAALAVVQSANQYSKLAFSAEQLTRCGLAHSGLGVDALRPREQSTHPSYVVLGPRSSAEPQCPVCNGPPAERLRREHARAWRPRSPIPARALEPPRRST